MQAKYPGTCAVCGERFPAGTTIAYDRITRETRHADCAPFVAPAGSWWISRGQGYGGAPYVVGQVIRNPDTRTPDAPRYLIVLAAKSEYVRDDGYSFGVGDESGYLYSACVRAATDDESATLRADEARATATRQAHATMQRLAQRIRTEGAFAPHGSPMPEGAQVFDTQTIHGSGSVFVITDEGAWYLERHMMDGDDWAANNVAGVYRGWYLADPVVSAQLRDIAAL